MNRCMHAIKDEFDSQEQRVAVCLRQFRGGKDYDPLLDEKFAGGGNPNHDPATGRFTTGSGGGSGGDSGRDTGTGGGGRRQGPGGRKIPKAFTREWFNYWARISQAFGRIAHLLQTALPVVLAAIETIKGLIHIHSAVMDSTKAASLDSLIQQIQDMSDEKRSDTLNQILDGLSSDEADQVLAAIDENKAFDPNQARDNRGRWTRGGGGSSASANGGGRSMVAIGGRIHHGTILGAADKDPWTKTWATKSEPLGALAIAATLGGIYAATLVGAFIFRKGLDYVRRALGKPTLDEESAQVVREDAERNAVEKQTANMSTAQQIADEILAQPIDKQHEIWDELLGGLTYEDAQAIYDAVVQKSDNPFDAFRAAIARQRQEEKYDPNQARDDHGRWTSDGRSIVLTAHGVHASGKIVKYEFWKDKKGKIYWRTPSTGDSAGPFSSVQEAMHHAEARSRGLAKNLGEFVEWKRSTGNGAVMETKDFALEVGDVTDKGFFSGYASTYDVDLGQDKVVQGAFTKSLGSRMPLMLWSHDPKSPIGVWNKVAEDTKGLNVDGRILIDQKIPEADKAYALLKAKAIRGLSIGYRVKDAEQEGDVRLLKELELPEISIVSMPMNQNASVSSVKADELFFKWAMFEDWARRVRDGEVPPIKELENLLREAGVPKSVAVQIASVGYAKTIRRSDSGESDEATTDALTRLKAAVKAFS